MTRVLLVDDHTRSRQEASGVLQSGGYDVVGEGSSGMGAAGLISATAPHVVLMAVGLGDLDGISAAQQIMAAKPTPIIILTSHHDTKTIQRAAAAGVMGYLVKPLRAQELSPAIEMALAHFQEFATLRNENAMLKKNLEARKVIEKAKGILMESHGYTESEAFSLIKRESMNLRKPMKEIAEALILSETFGRSGKG
jgi:AmiR/NasT family two-component response regulator